MKSGIIMRVAGRVVTVARVANVATRGRGLGVAVAVVAILGLAATPSSAATARLAAPPHAATPPAAATPPHAPAQTARRQRAAGVRQALAHSTVPDTCSGAITPDTIYPCSTPSTSGTDTFTLTVADTKDLLYVVPLSVTGNDLGFTLTAPDTTAVSCQQSNSGQYVCPTSQSGTYTLAVSNGGGDYTLDYTALLSDTSCTAINPSFAAPALAGNLAAGQTGSCYTLDVPTGSVLYLMGLDPSVYPTDLDVYDSAGVNQNCDLLGANTCTVGGTGPYRIFLYSNGTPDTYKLQLDNLTNPQGCVGTPRLRYGQVPDTSSTDPCRTFTVTTAGSYQVVPVYATGGQVNGTVYAASGSVACQYYQYPFCPLTPGSYDFVVAPGQQAAPFGFVFIAGSEAAGCTATKDTGFQSGPATGTFAGLGEELCLTLPTPNGKADYFAEQDNTDGTAEPSVEVIDATGALQCGGNADFAFDSCTLSGTAPFRVLLSAVSTPESYRFLIQRTDTVSGCATWPQSGFGGTWGATVTLTGPSDIRCLKIPAGQHATGEMIDYSNNANVTDGAITVYDPAGQQVCAGVSTTICAYQTGVTYTALVTTTAAKGDTYHLVRRDVSRTAKCSTPVSTTVGGPSTTFTLTSDLDTVCYRVTAKATDDLWFSVRALGITPPGSNSTASSAVLEVTNASGAFVCRQRGTPCRVSGSADYQIIVTASGYGGVAITAHLDTWKVGGASGWAPECAKNKYDATDGFPIVKGTLTEHATAYCAVVTMEPGRILMLAGWASAAYQVTPQLSIYQPADFTPVSQPDGELCGSGASPPALAVTCIASVTNTAAIQGVLILNLDGVTGQSPVSYAVQGLCWGDSCAKNGDLQANFASISPASQPAASGNTITVTGSGLSFATNLELLTLSSSNTATANGVVTAVNDAGTSMTVSIDTSALPPGTYDVWSDQASCSPSLVGCPGWLLGAYTVTKAPAAPPGEGFTPLNPARVLDTRSGVGAAKKAVAPGATVTLTVAGRGGVPATGATAVAVDITAIGPSATGNLIAYPANTTRPAVTDLSFAAGKSVTNLAVVSLKGGKIALYNASGGTVNLTADVVGYYAAGQGSAFTARGPARILDTRSGLGAAKAKVAAHGTVTLTVAGRGGVPASGATAVALNITALTPGAGGTLTSYPAGTSRPATTALSFASGKTAAGLSVTRLAAGKVSIYNDSAKPLDLTADVVGYYGSGSMFLPVGPMRILNTQSGLGGSGQTILAHSAAVTNIVNVTDPTVTAVVLEVSVIGPQDSGALTAFPDDTALPGSSTFPFTAGQSATGLVVLPVVNGNIDFFNDSAGTIQVIGDLLGYYTS